MLAETNLIIAAAQDPDLLVPGNTDLSASQIQQLNLYNSALFRIREFAWFQYQDGTLDPKVWNSYETTALQVIRNSPETWEQLQRQLDPEMVAYFNDKIKKEGR